MALLSVLIAAVVALGVGVVAVVLARHDTSKRTAVPPTVAPTRATVPTTIRHSTTTTRVRTTVPPPVPALSTPLQANVALAQRWATALAKEEWSTAKAIAPKLATSTDDTLLGVYGGLIDAKIVFVSTTGSVNSFEVASVAHEYTHSVEKTRVYCFHIDVSGGTIQASGGPPAVADVSGRVPASALRGAIAKCDPHVGE